MELFHTATLLHDDVLDNADLRRGQAAAHRVFGVTETILAGDALLASGNSAVAAYGDARLTAVAAEAIAQTAGEKSWNSNARARSPRIFPPISKSSPAKQPG